MAHVRLHQMSRGQRRTQREFASKYTCSYNSRKLSSIVARVGGMRATDTEQIEHCCLRLEDGATTNSTDLDARHGHGDL